MLPNSDSLHVPVHSVAEVLGSLCHPEGSELPAAWANGTRLIYRDSGTVGLFLTLFLNKQARK